MPIVDSKCASISIKYPHHSFEIICDLTIDPPEITVMQGMAGLCVSRKTLSVLRDDHAGGFAVHWMQ